MNSWTTGDLVNHRMVLKAHGRVQGAKVGWRITSDERKHKTMQERAFIKAATKSHIIWREVNDLMGFHLKNIGSMFI